MRGRLRAGTYAATIAAVTRVIGLRGDLDGEFEGAAVAVAVVASELRIWSFHINRKLGVMRSGERKW